MTASRGSRMLETIREYGLERLRAHGREDEVRRLHAVWFLELAERAEPELQGWRPARVLRRLAAEHENLRAALSWAAEVRRGCDARSTASALWRFWFPRGHLTEGRDWLARALVVEGLPDNARARALRGASVLAAVAGDLEDARSIAVELVELRRRLGIDEDIAEALVVLANVDSDLGDQDAAAAKYEEAATYARRQMLGLRSRRS